MIQQSRVHYIYDTDSEQPTAQFWPVDEGLRFAAPDDDDEPGFMFTLTWDDLLALCRHHPQFPASAPEPTPEPAK